MQARGDQGVLRVGYQRAAEIRSWCLTHNKETLGEPVIQITGRVEKLDQFWITQLPMAIGLWMGTVWWVWNRLRVDFPGSISIGSKIEVEAEGNPTIFDQF